MKQFTLLLKKIFLFVVVVSILLGISFSLEYFIFKPNILSQEYSFENLTAENIISHDGFLEKDGVYISQEKGAELEIKLSEQYANSLEITIEEDFTDKEISLSYVPQNTEKPVKITRRDQRAFDRHKIDFFDTLSVKIQDTPQKLVLTANDKETVISSVRSEIQYRFHPYRILFFFSIGLFLSFLWFLRKNLSSHPECMLLASILIIGTLLVVSLPREYISWDEYIHYKEVDKLSLREKIYEDLSDRYEKKSTVPFSYNIENQSKIDAFFEKDFQGQKIEEEKLRSQRDEDGEEKKKKDKDDDEEKSFMLSIYEYYSKIAYLPSATVLLLGRMLDIAPATLFILGRWINIFLFAIIVYFCTRRLISGKSLILLVTLLPTSLFLASGYHYDAWIIAFALLGFAYFFREFQEPEVLTRPKNWLIMIFSFLLAFSAKAIYSPLFLLFFFLRPSKFSSRKEYAAFLGTLTFSFLFVISSFVLPFVIDGTRGDDTRGGKEVNSQEQIAYILGEPLEYTGILFNQMHHYFTDLPQIAGFITFLAYLGHIQSIKWWVLIVGIMLLMALFLDQERKITRLPKSLRISTVILSLGIVSLFTTALYIAFTPVRSEIINGVQPRYLIPLLFPFFFMLRGSFFALQNKKRALFFAFLFVGMASMSFWGIWSLLVSQYY